MMHQNNQKNSGNLKGDIFLHDDGDDYSTEYSDKDDRGDDGINKSRTDQRGQRLRQERESKAFHKQQPEGQEAYCESEFQPQPPPPVKNNRSFGMKMPKMRNRR